MLLPIAVILSVKWKLSTAEYLNASALTPVPGGVGPMTITMLLKNTFTAAGKQGAKI